MKSSYQVIIAVLVIAFAGIGTASAQESYAAKKARLEAEWRAKQLAEEFRQLQRQQQQRERDYDARSDAPYYPSLDPTSGAGLWNKYYGPGSPYAPTKRPYRRY